MSSGEMQFYLGKRYVLKVERLTPQGQMIKMTRGKLFSDVKSVFDEHQKPLRVKATGHATGYQANARTGVSKSV